jgi:hypothetical protein
MNAEKINADIKVMEAGLLSSGSVAVTARDLPSLLAALAGLRVTSVLMLPGALGPGLPGNLDSIDKLTLAARAPGAARRGPSPSVVEQIGVELILPESMKAGEYLELTGYLNQLPSI